MLHFDQALSHAKHYIGSTCDLDRRLSQHRGEKSGGSKIMRALVHRGIGFSLQRTWHAGEGFAEGEGLAFEKQLKAMRQPRLLCPECRPLYLQQAREAIALRRARQRQTPIATISSSNMIASGLSSGGSAT